MSCGIMQQSSYKNSSQAICIVTFYNAVKYQYFYGQFGIHGTVHHNSIKREPSEHNLHFVRELGVRGQSNFEGYL